MTADTVPDAPRCPLRDDFDIDASSVCGDWGSGSQTGAATLSRMSNELTISSNGSAGSASCTSLQMVPFDRGVVVEIVRHVYASTGRIGLELTFPDLSTFQLYIRGVNTSTSGIVGTVFDGQSPAEVGYQPTTQRAWKLYHDQGLGQLMIETGPMRDSLSPFTNFPLTQTVDTVGVRLFAENGSNGSPWTGKFDNLDACP